MKMVTNICDAGATVNVDPSRLTIRIPEGSEKVSDPRLVVPFTLMLEHEVHHRRLEAAREFARLNGVNRVYGGRHPLLGIATPRTTYYVLPLALRDMGILREPLEALGISIP